MNSGKKAAGNNLGRAAGKQQQIGEGEFTSLNSKLCSVTTSVGSAVIMNGNGNNNTNNKRSRKFRQQQQQQQKQQQKQQQEKRESIRSQSFHNLFSCLLYTSPSPRD